MKKTMYQVEECTYTRTMIAYSTPRKLADNSLEVCTDLNQQRTHVNNYAFWDAWSDPQKKRDKTDNKNSVMEKCWRSFGCAGPRQWEHFVREEALLLGA